MQTQQIHLLRIKENGELVHLQTIGTSCFPDDELFLERMAGGRRHASAAGTRVNASRAFLCCV